MQEKIKLKEFINFYKVLKKLKSSNRFMYYDLLQKYGSYKCQIVKQKNI